MTFEDLIRSMTPETYASLRQAVELGRWADGRALSAEQRASSLQAVMAYEALCLDTGDEPFRMTPQGEIRVASKPKKPREERLSLQQVEN